MDAQVTTRATGKQSRDALQRAISAFRNVKVATKTLADAQKTASEAFLKWSLTENNLAIQDIVFQVSNIERFVFRDSYCICSLTS